MQTRKTLAAAAIGLALAAAAQAEITVGVSLGTTGPGASLGIPYKNAFQLVPSTIAVEPVRYVILDDESKPDNAAKNARKFVTEDKVDVLMGSNGVPSGVAITQVAAEARTPMISLTPLPPLAPERQPWVFIVMTWVATSGEIDATHWSIGGSAGMTSVRPGRPRANHSATMSNWP